MISDERLQELLSWAADRRKKVQFGDVTITTSNCVVEPSAKYATGEVPQVHDRVEFVSYAHARRSNQIVSYVGPDGIRLVCAIEPSQLWNPQEFRLLARGSEKPSDPVDRPAHYGNLHDCISAIRMALTPEEFAGYLRGTMTAYEWRADHKGNAEQDRAKAAVYRGWLTKGASNGE